MDAMLADPSLMTSPVRLETPLGSDLTFHSMEGSEGLSRPFVYEVDVLSRRPDLEPSDLLGHSVTVHLDVGDDEGRTRVWNGRVTRLEYHGASDDGLSRYRLTMRPWLWLLTRAADCRVFQNISVPQIVAQVFKDRGFTDFDWVLFERYETLEHVIQYRETDLEFISRLLARVGIYYFFRHEDGRHTLILADSTSAHDSTPGCERLPFAPEDVHRDATMAYVRTWKAHGQVEPSGYSHASFDFTKPRARLQAGTRTTDQTPSGRLEVYDYHGGFTGFREGETGARLRLEQARRDVHTRAGESNARGLAAGAFFDLTGHPRDDQNRQYLVTSASYRLRGSDVSSGGTDGDLFACSFHAIHADLTFRPPPPDPKSVMRGPQTATVVGPEGHEIWTDRYGRVKVQFHWDREGGFDEKSSCFVRVSQAWAGTGFGAQFIPRVGQEVIVDFLEGDPDRPIITGSVYNASNMPPFDLPRNATQSGFRTRSTKGGNATNGNEIRFDDKRGGEEVFIQAERDRNALVKNDDTVSVFRDRSAAVGRNERVTVGGARAITVAGDDSLGVGGSLTANIAGDRRSAVQGCSLDEVTGTATTAILGSATVTVGAGADLSVAGAQATRIGGQHSLSIQGSRVSTIGGDDVASVGRRHSLTVGTGGQNDAVSDTFVWGSYRVGTKRTMVLESEEAVVLRCGSTELRLTPQSLELLGQAIQAIASKEVQLTGKGPSIHIADDVQVTAKQITLLSSGARLALSDTAKLTGSKVQLGNGSGGSTSSSSKTITTQPFALTMLGPDHKPLANRRYQLEVDGRTFEGTTDGSGALTAHVTGKPLSGRCTVWTGEFPEGSRVTYHLEFSALESASSPMGAQQRLINLGYLGGSPNPIWTHAAVDALLLFQRARKLATTGRLDGPTIATLSELHP